MKRQQTGNSVKNFVQQIAKIQTFYWNIQARSTAYIKFYYKSVITFVFEDGNFNSTQQSCSLSASLFGFSVPNYGAYLTADSSFVSI